jgi:hypothetical protein
MQKQLQRLAMFTALAIGAAALSATPALATPTAQDQDHRDRDQNQHPDYSNNSYYRLGNKEGLQDHRKNLQRSTHNHNYKTDMDKRAHDDGYHQGWQGQNYRDNHRDPR